MMVRFQIVNNHSGSSFSMKSTNRILGPTLNDVLAYLIGWKPTATSLLVPLYLLYRVPISSERIFVL